jgi:tRNA1(Val) A37 N6-methylase TrmN6
MSEQTPREKDGKEQLKSYCHATDAPIGVWSNGSQMTGFDVLMANPPFADDTKQGDILSHYELGHKANGKGEATASAWLTGDCRSEERP